MRKTAGFGRVSQATDDNIIWHMGVAYKHTLRICNTYCFCTATAEEQMDRQTRLKTKGNSHETIDTTLRACFVFLVDEKLGKQPMMGNMSER